MANNTSANISANNTVAEYFAEGDWWGLVTDAYLSSAVTPAAIGEVTFAVLMGFTLIGMSWIFTGSITIPVILVLMFSGVVSAALPGVAGYAAYIFVSFAIAASLYRIFQTTRRV